MNLKIKQALAVAGLALVGSAAQAAIPSGHIVFNEWNNATNAQGYTWDTGLTVANLASNFTVTLTNSAAIAAFNAGNLQWNVAGADSLNYYTSVTTNNLSLLGSNLGEGNFEQSSAVAQAATIYGALTTNTASLLGPYWAASFSQGNGSLADPTDKLGAGTVYFAKLDTNATASLYSGTWTLSFLNAAGGAAAVGQAVSAVLSWTSSTAVPLPAAVWLLGSGLAGLAGVGRRRQKTEA